MALASAELQSACGTAPKSTIENWRSAKCGGSILAKIAASVSGVASPATTGKIRLRARRRIATRAMVVTGIIGAKPDSFDDPAQCGFRRPALNARQPYTSITTQDQALSLPSGENPGGILQILPTCQDFCAIRAKCRCFRHSSHGY